MTVEIYGVCDKCGMQYEESMLIECEDCREYLCSQCGEVRVCKGCEGNFCKDCINEDMCKECLEGDNDD